MKEQEHIESDLGIASFLLVGNFKLLGLDTNDGRRYLFRFADPERKAEGQVMGYLQGASAVARELVDAQKTLKALLYKKKRGEL